jgi:hypothetical protein
VKIKMKGEKLIASILAAIMTLATFVSPVLAAIDLGDYSGFLFEEHNLDAYVVVGADANPADVVGAIDLAVRLAGESYEEVACGGEGTLAGAVSEEVPLGEVIAGGAKLDTTLKHYKLSGLADSSVSFQDETYDFHEEIQLTSTADNLDVETSLTASDDDYTSNVYIELAKDAIRYAYTFDENINISTTSSDEPLEIEFLGKTLKITSVSDADTITAEVGDEYSLNVGDSVTVLGKTVKLVNVGSGGSVIVDVDGVTATISQDTTKTVNGVKVKPTEYFYAEAKEERMASLLIGEETTESYDDGDPYIGQDDDDPEWIWNLALLTSNSPTIGIENDFVKDDHSDEPAGVGDCYVLPNDFAKVCLDSLTIDSYQQYEFAVETGVDLSDAGATWSTSNSVIAITSPGEDEGLQEAVSGSDYKSDTIYLKVDEASGNGRISVFYVDADGDVTLAGNATLSTDSGYVAVAQVNFQDTDAGDMYLSVAGNFTANNYFYLRLNNSVVSGDDLRMKWGTGGTNVDKLGDTADDSEAAELAWSASLTGIGTKDEDHRSIYGVLIKDPDTNGASDQVVLDIPADQVEGKVIVYGPGAEVTAGEGENVKKVVPITSAVAKLDTEISDPATVGKHLVLVGGPAVNKLSAQAMGLDYPTYGGSGLLPFAEGEGYIEVFEDGFTSGQVVVLVAGWEADQTRMATSLLQRYTEFADELEGNTAVKITSLSAAGITPV